MIQSARYINPDKTAVEATMEGRGAVLIGSNPADVAALDTWVADGNTIAAYQEPTPSTNPNDYPLEPYQFFAMLEIMGKEAAVEAAIDAIEDTSHRAIARAKWKHTTRFDRDDPLFAQLAPVVGLTDAQIDAAWMQAKDF